jgi:general secretion pathway protein D
MNFKLYLLVIPAMLFWGCSSREFQLDDESKFSTQITPTDKYFLDLERSDKGKNIQPDTRHLFKTNNQVKRVKKIEDMTYRGQGKISASYTSRYSDGIKKRYNLIAEEMPVNEFLYYVFQEILKSDFTVDPKIKTIKEKITLKLSKRLSKNELLEFLEDILKPFGVEIIEKDGVYRANLTGKYNDKTTNALIMSQNIRNDIPDNESVAQYIECEYIDVNTLMTLSTGIFIKPMTFKPVRGQNGVIVYGSYGYIKKLLNFKKIVDRPFMKNKKTTLVYFDYITPSDFKRQFSEILSYQNLNNSKNNFKLLPLDEINALMVITSNSSDLQFLLRWKRKLDNYRKSNDTQETYFYKSKYRSIKEIYALISQFNGMNMSAGSKKSKSDKPLFKDTKKEFVKTEKTDIKKTAPIKLNTANNGKQNVKIIPDEERNVLIIQATPAEYKKLLYILKKVDTQPLQLLVEANIIEVTLKDDLQYGMEWFLRNYLNKS